jgi:hypothetical protein
MTWRGLSNDKSSLTFLLGQLALSHLRLLGKDFHLSNENYYESVDFLLTYVSLEVM